MPILQIRDENGNWMPVRALRGEKGEKGEQGVPGKDAVTDQTYNPESENAQSGTAVAQAIAESFGTVEAELSVYFELSEKREV